MSTSAVVTFIEKTSIGEIFPVCSVRHHSDGYIDGVGHKLAKWLSDKMMINGMTCEEESETWKYANGVGCLAAKYIHDVKNNTGNVYMASADSDGFGDYNYRVVYNYSKQDIKPTPANDCITIEVETCGAIIFEGKPSELARCKDRDINDWFETLDECLED